MKATGIYESIEQAIAQKELRPGNQLPTIREAANHWGVNKNTVAVAYRMLQDAGLVIASGRNGSVIAGEAGLTPLTSAPSIAPAGSFLLHAGNPDRALLPPEALVRTHLLKIPLDQRLYGETTPAVPLQDWASQSFEADAIRSRRGFITNGALDAMSWALRTTLKIGDRVGLEDPAFATTLGLVRSMGLRPHPITMDFQGIDPESLSHAVQRGCKVIILSTRAQNPTGICTTAERAAQLRQIVADSPNTLFMDDDHSSMLQLSDYHGYVAGSAARWMVIRSVSKFLGPDYRVAVCRGDDVTMARVERAQSYSMGWVSSMLQNLAGSLLHDRQVRALIKKAGTTYTARFKAFQRAIDSIGLPTIGDAGLNIWVPCPDEASVSQQLLFQGWKVRSGTDFAIESVPGIRVTTASLDEGLRTGLVGAFDTVLRHEHAVTA